jgi:hypothetical protein
MIVGNGLIAKAFHENYANNDDVLIFASGVSNSSNTDPNEFLREKTLLESFLSEQKKIIYFSTCSIEDPSVADSPYILHKLEMEKLIKSADDYLIFRLTQPAGKTDNPNTLLNYLCEHIKSKKIFNAYSKAVRNIIDIADVKKIASHIIETRLVENDIVNITSPIYLNMFEIIEILEKVLNKKANFKLEIKGNAWQVDSQIALDISKKLDINYGDNYVFRTIKKYYA